jgi:23S rRNA pseudouridine2605 synthase
MDGNDDQHKPGERIAKVIARAGLASRRNAEEWIAAGRVAVNGEVIRSPALNVTAGDRVSVDGQPLPARERTRLFLYHKPRGLMTTHADPQGRPTIFQKLPPNLPRLVSVGRLDFNTEGLLLLTNDGALARALELPATGWLRRYRVRAHGAVTQAQLDTLRGGITIDGIHYGDIEAVLDRVQGSNLWLTFAIREGKNREVRNVLGHLGLTVTRLIRVSFGPFQLAELALGAVEEVPTRILREQLGARLVAQSRADFSAPLAAPLAPAARPALAARPPLEARAPSSAKPKTRKSPHHAWRAHEQDQPGKKLRRKFHGARGKAEPPEPPRGEARESLLTDRKGRHVAVERHGEPPPHEPREERKSRFLRPRGRHRSSDRATGPRPRHPRERR